MRIARRWQKRAVILDEDGRPLPPRPHEPPGPSPRRGITFGRPMVIAVAVVIVAFLVLCVLIARFGE